MNYFGTYEQQVAFDEYETIHCIVQINAIVKPVLPTVSYRLCNACTVIELGKKPTGTPDEALAVHREYWPDSGCYSDLTIWHTGDVTAHYLNMFEVCLTID